MGWENNGEEGQKETQTTAFRYLSLQGDPDRVPWLTAIQEIKKGDAMDIAFGPRTGSTSTSW